MDHAHQEEAEEPLPVSVLSWFAVERPALRWAKRPPRLATAET